MFLRSRVLSSLACHPSAVPSACMSLEALWSKHSSRAVRTPAKTEGEVADIVPSCSTQAPPIRKNRKRPAVPGVLRHQSKTPKRSPISLPAGPTDLGSGALVIFQPNVFSLSDSQHLYRALKVVGQVMHLSCTALLSPCTCLFKQHVSLFQQRVSIFMQEQVSWQHKEVVIYGKKVMQPRQVAYMASNTNLSYTYSHTKLQPEEWNPHVAQIKVNVAYQVALP